jgi:hypothetical protein
MIDADELKQASKLSGFRVRQQEKSYVQLAILRSIYSRISKELVFKGGTSLFFTENLNRFSEDLDFTLNGNVDLESTMSAVVSDLNYLGIISVGQKMSDTALGFGFRIESQGPLFSGPKTAVYTRIDVSRRTDILLQTLTKVIRPIYSDVSELSLVVLDPSEIVAEKVRAIYSRKQARDVYDLYFLVNKDIRSSLDIINKKLSLYDLSFDVESFKKKVSEKKEIWHAEMDPLVMGVIPDFDVVIKTIMRAISQMVGS